MMTNKNRKKKIMKMKKIIINIFLGILISIFLLILSVQYYSFNNSYLYNHIDKNVPVNDDDLKIIVENISNYLKDDLDNLEFKITYDNKERLTFNEREISHMVDVKNIFLFVNKLKIYIITIILACIFLIRKKYLINSIHYSLIISILSATIFSIIIINNNFNYVFIKFHELIFSNRLWILYPETDLLINLLPLNFFISIAIAIIILFFSLELFLSGIILLLKKYSILKKFLRNVLDRPLCFQ